jgi:tRNA uridine 5-carboxymethylaminomethyl modification enzyme
MQPDPQNATLKELDVLVVGGGHAGIEAALAAARLGADTALLTLRLDKVGEMSCNPAIGGLGKGQIVCEIDALGGAMGRVADETGIQFKLLNGGKGAAVRGPRCQSDRHLYRRAATREVERAGVRLLEGAADGLLLEGARVRGVRLADGRAIAARAVVVTTGTFLRAVMHTGEAQVSGGRVGEGTTSGLSADLARLGLVLGRLKTGTPPRLARDSIRWEALEPNGGDAVPTPFSAATDRARFPALRQVDCHVTWTNARTHELIRANIHLAPMHAGRIQGVGPRYCPSVEDKVVRFADKERHQVFLEPESLSCDVIYVNGVSTSLPAPVQEEFLRTIAGLEQCRFLRHGYAVEYDFVQPFQLDDTLRVRCAEGLWLAGQINGTSGYEEAAGQGLLAGANAALWTQGRERFVLGRHEAYLGVMVDDLITSNPTEPYRMFTSRAEHRLLLRADNAHERLARAGAQVGLVPSEAIARLERKEARRSAALAVLRATRHEGRTLAERLLRPQEDWSSLEASHAVVRAIGLPPEEGASLESDLKYSGYIERAERNVERLARQDELALPSDLDYHALAGLSNEARDKLARLRPRTLGAAGRIAGVRPPDVALLAIHVERRRREAAGGRLPD